MLQIQEANSIPTKDKILGNLVSNLRYEEGIYILYYRTENGDFKWCRGGVEFEASECATN
jgi:hypothetical protein